MKYKYLKEWAENQKIKHLKFQHIHRFEEQFLVYFRNTKEYLHINLSSQASFCFFSKQKNELKDLSCVYNNFEEELNGTILQNVSILNEDRIIKLDFDKINIYNQKENYSLIIELIPRYQNLILIENKPDKMQIIESWKKISFAENTHRQILPGVKYEYPPSDYVNKPEQVQYPLFYNSDNCKIVEKAEKGFERINDLFESIYYDCLIEKEKNRLRNQKLKDIRKKIKKKKRKLQKLNEERKSIKKEKKWKQMAELLKANYNKIKPEKGLVILKNYYEDNFPEMKIPLKTDKTVQENVERYFKKYRKAK
mgnify:FL=1